MHLAELGWTPFFKQHFQPFAEQHLIPVRITRQDKQSYQVRGEGDLHTALLPGALHQSLEGAERPVVGDWVAIAPLANEQKGIIRAVLPRTSSFSRKHAGTTTREQVIAANMDTVFLVNGLDGDFNLRRIERYVTQAWNSGAMPVVLLNKADLCEDVDAHVWEVEKVAMGVDVHALSARQNEGLDVLHRYVTSGKTVAFLGSSGVGKSTLVNYLLGEQRMKTSEVREDDSRGRHTTTHRELVFLPDGGMVIDTPGLRELQLWGDVESLQDTFTDIEDLATQCRFRDCAHETEPGCAVQAALETGELDPGRYSSYQKLRKELDYLARRQDEAGAYQQRQHVKKLTKYYKQVQQNNHKRREG